MNERTLNAIYAGPIGNNEGGFYTINLNTGQQIKHNQATIFPATQAFIDRIQELATKDKMNSELTFGDDMGKAAISDITTTENTEDDNASDGDYSVETDATEILITDTIVNADNSEITIDPEVTNYYTPIQDGEISNDNDETHEIDETISLHEEARGSNEEIRPDEAQ